MAKLGSLSRLQVGTLTRDGQPPEKVRLTRELLPFEMAKFTARGLDTEFAATSVLWASRRIGVVLKDPDGLFHAVETDRPRPQLGEGVKFTPATKLPDKLKVAGKVALPEIAVSGLTHPKTGPGRCFVAQSTRARQPATEAGRALTKKMENAAAEWGKWHHDYRKTPPPRSISKPFVEVLAILLDREPAEIAILQRPKQVISDQVSIDFFQKGIRGLGGFGDRDLFDRVASAKKGKLAVILQIQAEAFLGAVPTVQLVGTAIHEAAHYRHYTMSRQLIRRWRKTREGSSFKSRPITEDVFARHFITFLGKEVKGKKLSRIGQMLVASTVGFNRASHPVAQFHAFMALYPFFPRELDQANQPRDRGLINQVRFHQLLGGILDWNFAHRSVTDLALKAIADYAKREGVCATTDLRELGKEFEAQTVPVPKGEDRKPFFKALAKLLPP